MSELYKNKYKIRLHLVLIQFMEGSNMRKKIYTRQVGVLFSEITYEELIRITDEIEISVSEFIRSIVEKELKKNRKKEIEK